MRHRRNKYRLNRARSLRAATLVALSRNILIHQRIRTTLTHAKALRPLLERLIRLGKRGDLTSRREAFSILQDHKLVQSLFSKIAPQFKNRNGGCYRIIPCGFRRGDGARLAILELTERAKIVKKKIKKEEPQVKPREKITETEAKPPTKSIPAKEKKQEFLGGLRKIFRKGVDTPK